MLCCLQSIRPSHSAAKLLFSVVQICYEYSSHMSPSGLMFEGFKEMYDSGHGCADTDYTNLGYSNDPTPATIAKAKSSARDTDSIDIWDPTAVQQQVRLDQHAASGLILSAACSAVHTREFQPAPHD